MAEVLTGAPPRAHLRPGRGHLGRDDISHLLASKEG